MPVVVKTPPVAEPITLLEAKGHLRVDDDLDDAYITDLITAAREFVEDQTGRALVRQTWVYSRGAWPQGREISLPGGRMLSLTSCTYLDDHNIAQAVTVLADTESIPARVVLPADASWPSAILYPVNPIRVEYECGYGDVATVPLKMRQAMYLLIGHWYEHRESVVVGSVSAPLALAVESLIGGEKVYWDESR